MIEILTERLILREWRDGDLLAWAQINADPEVRQYLGPVLTEEQSAASLARFREDLRANGIGFLAVEVRDTGQLVGMAGLDPIDPDVPFPGVEIGWRLARSAWGHGYASEAARAALDFGFNEAGLSEIYAITLAGNIRSQAVMRRIGMVHAPELDFAHEEEAHTVFRMASP